MSTPTACSPDDEQDSIIGEIESQRSGLPSKTVGNHPPSVSKSLQAGLSSSSIFRSDQHSASSSPSSRPIPLSVRSPSTSTLPSSLQAQSYEHSSTSSPIASPFIDSRQDIRDLIIRSFAPRVTVYASADTEDFLRGKGFKDGLCALVRPYGERLLGRVIIRDSIGGSRAWEDFGIRFLDSQQLNQHIASHPASTPPNPKSQGQHNEVSEESKLFHSTQGIDHRTISDQVLCHSLQAGNGAADQDRIGYFDRDGKNPNVTQGPSSLYDDYLHKLLSDPSLVPHETFSHPVACMIAVSSHNPAPIEALRQTYASTNYGGDQAPRWMNAEYLRYYVLIHDEENDDITKSTALFDLMKRHFGLHCHLLRLRASKCVPTNDDSIRVPRCEWVSAEEELDTLRAEGFTNKYATADTCIPESEAASIRSFLREMVTQSIVPFMEKRMMTWNDQVASRRRGISGRFMSLSKRWTGFGYSKNATSESAASLNPSGSNYDHEQGIYHSGTPEATMRQMGDYAFMLRDWRLALSTYDLLRTDFNHDKAWAYHAAANEMAAITSLLIPQTPSSKLKAEDVNVKLDNAVYSYLTRCSLPANAIRCLTLAIELFQTRGSIAVDDAARWGGRLLELNILSSLAQTLMTERLADCYALRKMIPLPGHDGRRRQIALWNLLAADCWIRLDQWPLSRHRLDLAKELYDIKDHSTDQLPLANRTLFWSKLNHALGSTDSVESSSALVNLEHEYKYGKKMNDQESDQLETLTDFKYAKDIDQEGFVPQDASHPRDTNVTYLRQLNDGFT